MILFILNGWKISFCSSLLFEDRMDHSYLPLSSGEHLKNYQELTHGNFYIFAFL